MRTVTNWILSSFAPLVVLTMCACLLPVTATGEVLPDTPAGQRMEEILDLINEGDSETVKKYVSEEYTPEFRDAFPEAQHAGVFRQIRGGFPGLVPVSVIESSDDMLKVLMKSEDSGLWLEIQVLVEEEPPHRIASLGMRPAKAPPGEGQAKPRQPEISGLGDLEAYLKRAEEDNAFSFYRVFLTRYSSLSHRGVGCHCILDFGGSDAVPSHLQDLVRPPQ